MGIVTAPPSNLQVRGYELYRIHNLAKVTMVLSGWGTIEFFITIKFLKDCGLDPQWPPEAHVLKARVLRLWEIMSSLRSRALRKKLDRIQ